jgi:hypothetical protein
MAQTNRYRFGTRFILPLKRDQCWIVVTVTVLSGHGVNNVPLDLVLHILRIQADITSPVSKFIPLKAVVLGNSSTDRILFFDSL